MLDGPAENKAILGPSATKGDMPTWTTTTLRLWKSESCCSKCGAMRWRSGDERRGCGCGEADRDDNAEPIADPFES